MSIPVERLEQQRRSIAMAPPGSQVLTREAALELLQALIDARRALERVSGLDA